MTNGHPIDDQKDISKKYSSIVPILNKSTLIN